MHRVERWTKAALALAAGAILVFAGSATAGSGGTFTVDASRSSLEIDVAKAGFLKAFGHDHVVLARELSGEVLFDPGKIENSSVTIRVAAASLQVSDPEISDKDRAEVQSTMLGDKVLDVTRFPEILFTSTGVSGPRKEGSAWSLTLAGKLRLHGVEKPLSLPLQLTLSGAQLEAKGEVSILQTDYGITPVKAAGGTVKVKDSLTIRFTIRARGTAS